jgi:uncharacterized protein YyaL (SSP411 family)
VSLDRKTACPLAIALVALVALVAQAGCRARSTPRNDDPVTAPSHPQSHSHTNRLAGEKSPYLLQHAHNPVDWFPWGDGAFARARRENKPIFLSIGYSTCHWCHVMERESFEDEHVAQFLNEHFVSIKVDREERPDVDQIYMTSVQAMSGQGGWPLNVFLTPDLKPFYGGTYFPPDSGHGRPSLMQVLTNIHQLWQSRHGDVLHSATDLHQRLETYTAREATNRMILDPAVLHEAARQFKGDYDADHGGFSGAPKFPRPSEPAFLLRYGTRFRDESAVRMVLHTCEGMAAGGMHDQVGGGFHRYSVDARWLVPHFEKMLYDNAQLVNLYLDAYLVSGETRFADVARDIIRYVLRDMTHPQGGFYSAEDADSEGKEGKFYCWTREELSALLTEDEFKLALRRFGVTDKGNFVDHSDPDPLPNQNVLSIVDPKLSESDKSLLASAMKKMFDARSKRVRPHLDDKVLSSWNGLMLGALARAYAVLGDDAYRVAAEKNLAFIQAKLWVPAVVPPLAAAASPAPSPGGEGPGEGGSSSRHDSVQASGTGTAAGEFRLTGTLYHRWRDGERDKVQLLDAYAYLLAGVIDLYEATLDPRHLEFALALAETMLARFHDRKDGGFWQAPPDTADLILRVKDDYDGAEPSGNSVAILALLKLGAITDRKDFREAAEKSLRLFDSRLHQLPQAVPHLLLALDYWLEEPRRAVVIGNPNATGTRLLIHSVHAVYQPNKVVLGNIGPVEPFARTLPSKEAPVVFLCTGTACQPPTSDPSKIKELLK